MRYFLVEFDGYTYPARVTEFTDQSLALHELKRREPLEAPDGETVLLFADSEEAIRITHSRYFEDPLESLDHALRKETEAVRGRLEKKPAAAY